MPTFTPFRALRYAASDLRDLVAPPYDVQSPDQSEALARRSPHNIVAIDVPAVTQSAADDPYAAAAATLEQWRADGILVQDDRPTLTIHRMGFVDDSGEERTLVAVLGALEVVDDGAGGVLAHERTTPKASTDRLDLTRATRANLSPVWGLSLTAGLTAALDEPGEAVAVVSVDGVTHTLERVSDPARIAHLCALVKADEVLIADGHHRYAVARAFRDEVRKETGRRDTAAETTLAYVGELVPEQLSVRAIHRLYDGVGHEALAAALGEFFDFADAPMPSLALVGELVERGALVLVGPHGDAQWLTPRAGAFEGVRALDGAWLEHALAGVAVSVDYEHRVSEVVEALVSGRAHSAVLIRPVPLAESSARRASGCSCPRSRPCSPPSRSRGRCCGRWTDCRPAVPSQRMHSQFPARCRPRARRAR